MKKLPAYIMVVALLVINIATVAHADCPEGNICASIQAVVSTDDDIAQDSGEQDNDQQSVVCDCCATCGGNHHNHLAFTTDKADHLAASNQTLHSQESENYFSQLHYPPSKPPKA